ncbi:MAG: carbohydrate binding family 9 domain-containing protein, partial [Chitinophagaceae bacterium]
MIKFVFLFLFFFTGLYEVAATEPERSMVARKVKTPPKIDGLLNEAEWKSAPFAEDFIINNPNFGAKASQPTKVYIIYDDQAIYIGAYLYDDPKLVRKQLTPRDGESRQDVDFFAVYFDTYNDDQNGFQFLVTSRNVQTDGRINPNRSSQFGPPSDYSWDAVWESKVSFQNDGWTVEMKIPYFSLRFAQKDMQDWGVN